MIKRVLHVLYKMDRGGTETWLMNVLRKIDSTRISMDFLCLSGEEGDYAPEIAVYNSKIIPFNLKKKLGNLIKFSIFFISILRQRKYNVVHSHIHFASGFVVFLSYIAGTPVRIAHSHNSDDGKRKTIGRKLYRLIMAVLIALFATDGIAASRPAARELFGRCFAKNKKWKVIYYGIDASIYMNLSDTVRFDVRKELGIPENVYVVGCVGRFVDQKNHSFLVEIAKAIVAKQSNVNFLLIGDGVNLTRVKRTVEDKGLGNYFIFMGNRNDTARLMKAMDIFVFPSLYEGFGLVVLEAQLSGLACLVSDGVPKETILVPGAVKFMSLTKSPEIWAMQLLNLFDKPKLDRVTISECLARSSFNIGNCISRLMEVYKI